MPPIRTLLGAFLVLSFIAGCGGYKSKEVNNLTISPKVAAVNRNGVANFSFAYETSGDPSVVWSTNGGSVSQSGSYRGPNFDGLFEVTVTSLGSPETFDKAVVAVGTSNKGTITPDTLSLGIGEKFTVSTAFTDVTNQAATWYSTGGKITSLTDTTASIEAPATAGSITVIARSKENPLIFGKRVVDVTAVAVAVAPDGLAVSPGASQSFTATVTGAKNKDVTWEASGGTITPAGVWTAPAETGTYTVTARSLANNTVTGAATIIVR